MKGQHDQSMTDPYKGWRKAAAKYPCEWNMSFLCHTCWLGYDLWLYDSLFTCVCIRMNHTMSLNNLPVYCYSVVSYACDVIFEPTCFSTQLLRAERHHIGLKTINELQLVAVPALMIVDVWSLV
jgi:hypothetical protein